MRSLTGLLLFAALAGCTFNPGAGTGTNGTGTPGTAGTGVTGSGGTGLIGGTGRGGSSGSSGTTSGAGGFTPTEDANCGIRMNPIQAVPPDLLIILDKSQSMTQNADGSACGRGCTTSKWTQMTAAIKQVVSMTDTTVRWGLKYFADSGTCGVGNAVAVQIGNTTGAMITTSINGTMPGGSTPTRLAVSSGAQYLTGLTDMNPRYILLATDGLPNCIPNDTNYMDMDPDGAVQAITDAATAGVPTFVVGIGTIPNATATLARMATAGGKAPAAAPGYYQVNTTADLVGVLNTIQGMVASCVFPLAPPPPAPDNIAVHADANSIPKDTTHANGWDYVGTCSSAQTTPCQIQVYGSWCDRVLAKEFTDVQALYGCPNGPPVP
jgi:hypothetical protein